MGLRSAARHQPRAIGRDFSDAGEHKRRGYAIDFGVRLIGVDGHDGRFTAAAPKVGHEFW